MTSLWLLCDLLSSLILVPNTHLLLLFWSSCYKSLILMKMHDDRAGRVQTVSLICSWYSCPLLLLIGVRESRCWHLTRIGNRILELIGDCHARKSKEVELFNNFGKKHTSVDKRNSEWISSCLNCILVTIGTFRKFLCRHRNGAFIIAMRSTLERNLDSWEWCFVPQQ